MSICTLPSFARLVSNRGSDAVGYKNREPNTRLGRRLRPRARSPARERATILSVKSELRARLRGRFEPPGDKSIGHRLALLSALASGRSRLHHFPPGQDCASTLEVLQRLGVEITRDGDAVEIRGRGLEGLLRPQEELDCGNSGSTLRMLAGLLAGRPFRAVLSGDASLRRRPVERIAVPLRLMGARAETSDGSPPSCSRAERCGPSATTRRWRARR